MKMTMKKKYLIFAAAALTLTACSNDENMDGPGAIRLSSGIEVQEVTRATTDIQNEAFDANEKIDVYINEATAGTPSTDYTQPNFPSSGNGVNIQRCQCYHTYNGQ